MTDHVTVSAATPRVQYVASGTQTAFTFPFLIFSASDLEVWVDAVLQPASAYSLSGVGVGAGGSVLFTVPPTANAILTLRRRMTIQRTSDLPDDGSFPVRVLNDELDYQTAALQQLAADNALTVKRSFLSSDTADLTLPEPVPGCALKWNTAGTGLVNSSVDPDVALPQAIATAQAQAAIATAQAQASTAARTACGADAEAAAADRAAAAQSASVAAAAASSTAQTLLSLGYLADWGLIIDPPATSSDWGTVP